MSNLSAFNGRRMSNAVTIVELSPLLTDWFQTSMTGYISSLEMLLDSRGRGKVARQLFLNLFYLTRSRQVPKKRHFEMFSDANCIRMWTRRNWLLVLPASLT